MSQHTPVTPATSPPFDPRSVGPPVPTISSWLTISLAAVWMLLAATIGVIATIAKGDVIAWFETAPVTEPMPHISLAILPALLLPVQMGAWVAGGVWLLGLRRCAEASARTVHHRRTPHWAITGWIVPVVNLWFPYQVISDCAAALRRAPRWLLGWWLLWLLVQACLQVSNRAGGGFASTGQIEQWILALQVGAVLVVLTGVYWTHLVRTLTSAAHEQARERARQAPTGGGAHPDPMR